MKCLMFKIFAWNFCNSQFKKSLRIFAIEKLSWYSVLYDNSLFLPTLELATTSYTLSWSCCCGRTFFDFGIFLDHPLRTYSIFSKNLTYRAPCLVRNDDFLENFTYLLNWRSLSQINALNLLFWFWVWEWSHLLTRFPWFNSKNIGFNFKKLFQEILALTYNLRYNHLCLYFIYTNLLF